MTFESYVRRYFPPTFGLLKVHGFAFFSIRCQRIPHLKPGLHLNSLSTLKRPYPRILPTFFEMNIPQSSEYRCTLFFCLDFWELGFGIVDLVTPTKWQTPFHALTVW